MEVILKKKAQNSIRKITLYIFNEGYPDTAIKFANRLGQFAQTLKEFPDKYPLCKKASFAKRAYRCVPFDKNYIFVYKEENGKLFVLNIIHTSRLK